MATTTPTPEEIRLATWSEWNGAQAQADRLVMKTMVRVAERFAKAPTCRGQ